MTNEEVARLLDDIGDMLEIQGENVFKVRAYHRAANSIRSLTADVKKLYEQEKLAEIPGVGAHIAEKVAELLRTGRLAYYGQLKKKVSPAMLTLMQVPSIGPKKAKTLYEKLHITSIDQLEKAAKAEKLRKLPGMSVKTEENIIHDIELFRKHRERILLFEALPIAERIVEDLRKQSFVDRADMAGSLRRMKETIGDIDLLAASEQPDKVADFFCSLSDVVRVLAKGKTKSSVVMRTGLQIDLRVVAPQEYGSALQYFTGSKEHSIRLRDIAKKKGLKISEYGIFEVKANKRLGGKTEEEIYEKLGIDFVPPALRENKGEVEAALEHRLPKLVELKDIKGDLHVHSKWSDGLSKTKDVAEVALSLGYDYVALCDHAEKLHIAGGMTLKEIQKRAEEIRELNSKLKRLVVLAGVELNIDNEGNVDYGPEVLKDFDLVSASIHTGFGQSEKQLTERAIRAVNNEYIHVLCHPTGRILGKREPYKIDLEKVFDEAKATGTLLELNSFPDRLDLKDDYLREAKKRGVRIAIGTDSHVANQLHYMRYGVATAQRGWLTKEEVVNTYPLEKLRKALKKR